MRTRIKICGLTREDDIRDAAHAGVDAVGLVFYPPSARAVDLNRAAVLRHAVPPFVSTVGLFVNQDAGFVREAMQAVALSMLQFHGDERAAYCEQFGLPYLKAARMKEGFDLINYATQFQSAAGLLLDTFVEGYGGAGKPFDWSLIPTGLSRPIVLSGGLSPANVKDAVVRVRPWAVDVSSGVEVAKGVKDRALIEAFVAGVHDADGRNER